ncbi:MAG TPA: serine/threonine-protein kinase [Polyangiaceae bacterium]
MPSAGQCIAGRYRLECPLGEGGMGSVWRARHLELDAPIAVKFQHAHKARSKGAAARFRKEARAAARLESPHVVRVVDFGFDDEVPYIAMELLEGESLRARLERQALTVEDVLDLTRQAANALDAAHHAGIVHRDFKPSNLFVVQNGEREIVKLLDFGIAKWFEGEPSAEGALTEDNLVVGSAHYMSPEQTRGETVDPRSDVWSLAVVAYQMLTGVVPFRGANIPDTLRLICAGRFEPPSRLLSPVYSPLDPVFSRAFELDLDLRFETAGEFSSALTAAGRHLIGTTSPRPVPSTTSGWAFGRDGATRSVALGRSRRRWNGLPRGLGISAAALALVAAALMSVSPSLQSSAPAAPRPAPPTRPVSAPAPLEQPSVNVATEPIDTASRNGERHEVGRDTATPHAARAPKRSRRSARPADVPAEPAASAGQRPGAHANVDPVFGLELPARQ